MTELDPLVGMDDLTKPLRSRLLQVPALRERYLANIRMLGEEMSWERMAPVVARLRAAIADRVARDTRKAFTTELFERDTSPEPTGTLRQFFEKRSKYLSGYIPKEMPKNDGGGRPEPTGANSPAKDPAEPARRPSGSPAPGSN